VVAAACRNIGRPLVFGSSSLWEATLNLDGFFFFDSPLERNRFTGHMYRYGVSHSRVIVAETEQIAALFRKRLPKSDVRHIPDPVLGSPPQERRNREPYAVSISRLIWYKRPRAFLQIARMLPDVKFMMAGFGPMEAEIREESARIPNLSFVGRQSPENALSLIRQARVFVNTSAVEGFPNTLSESLICETPYVSFYDPDEIICRYGLGAHVRSLGEAASAVRRYTSDEEEFKRVGARGREYLKRFHDTDSITRQYENLFADLSRSHG
jgi:glycosyltransferase involved in cell wall biosynthesis